MWSQRVNVLYSWKRVDGARFRLHGGVAAPQSDATLVLLVAGHPDVAPISKSVSPAGLKEHTHIQV